MRAGDLARDVQTEPESLPALGRGASERGEDPLVCALGNGGPFILPRDLDVVRSRCDADAHGPVWSAVHDRVHSQVREELLHPVGIPPAGSFTLNLDDDLA